MNPTHYREIQIELPNQTSSMVAALAKPNYCRQDPRPVFDYLKAQNIGVVFGLEGEPEFLAMASEVGIKYIDVSIPDFTAPNLTLYDEVYEELIKQNRLGKKIAIHCHGGMGRTGTVLAALKLREMALSDIFYQMPPEANAHMAIQLLRKLPGNRHIIETKEQETSLCDYSSLLHQRREEEDNHSKENTNGPG